MTKDDKAIIIEALSFAMKEISFWHRDVLIEGEHNHPHDACGRTPTTNCAAARDLLKGRAA